MRYGEDEPSGGTKALALLVTIVALAAVVAMLAMMPGATAPNTEHAMARAAGSAAALALPAWLVAVVIVLRKRAAWVFGSLLLFAAAGFGAAYSRIAIVEPAAPEMRILPEGVNVVEIQPTDIKATCKDDPRLPLCKAK